MKKLFLGIAVLVFASMLPGIAQSSISPEAAKLLEKAKAVHGGMAFDKLNVIFMRFQNAFPEDDQKTMRVFQFDVTLDFAGNRIFDRWFGAHGLAREYLVTPESAKGWYNNKTKNGNRVSNNDLGVLELDSFERGTELRLLRADVLTLRFGAKRDSMTALGKRTLKPPNAEPITGDAWLVTTQGEAEILIFADDGTLRGIKYDEGFTVFSDFKTFEGIRLPSMTRWYFDNGDLEGMSRLLEFKSMPAFEPSEFKPVKWNAERNGPNPFGFKPTPASIDLLTGLRLSAKSDWFLAEGIAAKAGLKPGDEIISVNGKSVQEVLYLEAQQFLWDLDTVVLEVKRSGQDGLQKFELKR
jgi:PDZ domain